MKLDLEALRANGFTDAEIEQFLITAQKAQVKKDRSGHDKAYRESHATEVKAYNKEWRKNNKDKIEKWREINRDKLAIRERDRNLKKYGLNQESYEKLLKSQNGVCAICEHENDAGRRLFVDHDHETGFVRGLLCSSCNFAIGMLSDSSQIMVRAVAYLHKAMDKQIEQSYGS